MSKLVKSHTQLDVYRNGFELAMEVFEMSKSFPTEERYSLTDQIRRSSRSVCANVAEAWRKRRYENAFIANLSDAEAEAAETQTWLEFAVSCQYAAEAKARDMYRRYESILGSLVGMQRNADQWILKL